MNDGKRSSELVDSRMHRGQSGKHIEHDGGDDRQRNALPTLLQPSLQASEGHAMHIFHDEQQLVALAYDVERRHDVSMAHPGTETRLVDEHLERSGRRNDMRMKALDRD